MEGEQQECPQIEFTNCVPHCYWLSIELHTNPKVINVANGSDVCLWVVV